MATTNNWLNEPDTFKPSCIGNFVFINCDSNVLQAHIVSLENYFYSMLGGGGPYETLSRDNKTGVLFGTLRSSTLLVSLALFFWLEAPFG